MSAADPEHALSERAFDDNRGDTGERVVVIGGGVIGCVVARELAPECQVLVLERDQIASGATALAAGEVTLSPSYTDDSAIVDHAHSFFRSYDGTGQFEYVDAAGLELFTSAREDAGLSRFEELQSVNPDVAHLDTDEIEARWPRFDMTDFGGGIQYPEMGHLDPYTFATTLKADAEERGAQFETGVTVTELLTTETDGDEQIVGVKTDHGTIACDVVVAAAGWRTRELLEPLVELPVRPYRTQVLVLRPGTPLSESFPIGWIPGEHVYFRRETTGDLLVGGWSFAENDPEHASRDADPEFQRHVAELVPQFLRFDDDIRIVDGWAGIDGATPDTRPIIDTPAEAPEGLVVATGFNGRGIMTAPVAGTLVRCLITGEQPPFSADLFSLSRFDIRTQEFEFVSVSAGGD